MADWTTLISSLGAAVIGGLVSPLVSQRRERVVARAEVRRALTEVEGLLWRHDEHQAFKRALASFEASAILASLPWRAVTAYSRAIEKVRSAIRFEEGVGPDGEDGYVLTHGPVTEAHTRALELVSWSLWHPWLGRLKR